MPEATQEKQEQLEDVKNHVEDFLLQTEEARGLAEKCRDYYDNKQWTDAEAAKLKSRGQAPIVVNRIKPKVEGLKGLYSIRKTDPKAFPRTQSHDQAAHSITDALRFVADKNKFDNLKIDVAENFFIEGYGGAMVDVRQKNNGEIDIRIDQIPWDRIYFDPHSRKRDFSDARYKGMIMWMDEDEVKEYFPDFNPEEHLEGNSAFDTFEDRPRWILRNKGRNRYRVAFEFYKRGGDWWMCIYTDSAYLVEPQISPFLDDEGEPCCIIELVGAYIDRENNRYGEVNSFLDQQDEINHRRSKALHLLSQRQTYGRKGEQKDIDKIKRELAKPNGHVEFQGEEFGKDFGILPTGDMAQGQFELYKDAKGELDSMSFNAQLAGERQSGDLSGKAIDRLQQAGTIELNSLYVALTDWENRIYRQVWARVKQFWNEEKWVRVTDDQDNLRWVGLNTQITMKTFMEEVAKDESKPLEMRVGATVALQRLVEAQDPRLAQIIEVRNPVAELDVDIILDQSFEVVNIQQEQFQLLAQFGQGQDIDIIELIELSQLRGKDELIEKIQKRRADAAQAAGSTVSLQAEKIKSEVALNNARAAKELKQLEAPANTDPVNDEKSQLLIKANDNETKKEIAAADRDSKYKAEIYKADKESETEIEKAIIASKPTAITFNLTNPEAAPIVKEAVQSQNNEAVAAAIGAMTEALKGINNRPPMEIKIHKSSPTDLIAKVE